MSFSAGDVARIFETMEYGPALDTTASLDSWATTRPVPIPSPFVSGSFVPATSASALDSAVDSARKSQPAWSGLTPHRRSSLLYSAARATQKHSKLLSTSAAPITRSLYYHAGWAHLLLRSSSDLCAAGVAVVSVESAETPTHRAATQISAALAAGCAVIVATSDAKTAVPYLALAEILTGAGIPRGVISVLPGLAVAEVACRPGVTSVSYFGKSKNSGADLLKRVSGRGMEVTMTLSSKCSILVFDSADLDSCVDCIVDNVLSSPTNASGDARVLVQESCARRFLGKLKSRLSNLRTMGNPMDKCTDVPVGCPKVPQEALEEARSAGCEVWSPEGKGEQVWLVVNAQPCHSFMSEPVEGPLISVCSVRSVAEAVTVANNSRFALAASVWSDNLNLAHECAGKLRVGTVWINSWNLGEASVGVCSAEQSGRGSIGGREGLSPFLRPAWKAPRDSTFVPDPEQAKKWASYTPGALDLVPGAAAVEPEDAAAVDRTYKLYVGGKGKRPDSGHSRSVFAADGKTVVAKVAEATRKDVRDAVEAACAAFPGWSATSTFLRSQILFYIAENLSARSAEFQRKLVECAGRSAEEAAREVDASVERLFYWASYCDKSAGAVQDTQLKNVLVVQTNEALGVVGLALGDDPSSSLLAFVSCVAAAISRGNSVVCVASERFPIAAIDLAQVFDTSDLVPGVVNVLTGHRGMLTKVLAEHLAVQALWWFGDVLGSQQVELLSADSLKRVWVSCGESRDWYDPAQGAGLEFLNNSTRPKNVWIPHGEQAFW